MPTADGSLLFADERAGYEPTGRNVGYGGGHRETWLTAEAVSGSVTGYVHAKLRQYRVYHFHDTSASAPVKQYGRIDDNGRLHADAGNLAAFLLAMREAERTSYERIVSVIRLAAPFFYDFVLDPLPQDPTRTTLRWRERGSDAVFAGHDLSDGTLRFICLATLLLQPSHYAPNTILIDEPELGLHPYAITLLASMLRSAVADGGQVIAATQSAPLVDELDPADLIVVDREPSADGRGASVFRRLDVPTIGGWLDDYSLGQLWRKNVLGASPGGLPVAAAPGA